MARTPLAEESRSFEATPGAAAAAGDGPWLALVNARAGRGRAARTWSAVARELDLRGVPHEAHATRCAGDATAVAAAEAARGRRRFVAVGGDGTLHEVANGILASGARCALAVVPDGTGNDWARGAGLPRSPEALAAMLAHGRTQDYDAGEIEYAGTNGRERRWFVNVAGCGYDAYVLERLSTRAPRGLAYLLAVAGGLLRYAPSSFAVRAGGAPHVDARLFVAFACLGRYCGGGMQFAPAADPADGALDVVTVRHLGIVPTLLRLPRIYSGRIAGDPAVVQARSAVVDIDADPPVRVEADGQLLGHTPARVRALPGALRFVLP